MTRPPPNASPTDPPDAITRYFLRRLALAHRKYKEPRVGFANALADTVLVFVGLPIAAVFSFVIATSGKWGLQASARLFGAAPQLEGLGFGAVVMLIGYLLLNRRMRKYVDENSDCYLAYDSEKDAQVVFWQRLSALIFFGIGPLLLAVLILAAGS
jgi:hypothetical protein